MLGQVHRSDAACAKRLQQAVLAELLRIVNLPTQCVDQVRANHRRRSRDDEHQHVGAALRAASRLGLQTLGPEATSAVGCCTVSSEPGRGAVCLPSFNIQKPFPLTLGNGVSRELDGIMNEAEKRNRSSRPEVNR